MYVTKEYIVSILGLYILVDPSEFQSRIEDVHVYSLQWETLLLLPFFLKGGFRWSQLCRFQKSIQCNTSERSVEPTVHIFNPIEHAA